MAYKSRVLLSSFAFMQQLHSLIFSITRLLSQISSTTLDFTMFKSIAFVSMLVASINATPTPLASAALTPRVAYKQFTGDGSKADGWPVIADWHTWESLFTINSALMKTSCSNNGFGTNDSPQEIAHIGQAIQTVSKNNGIDPRFVLAVVMEESAGCVRVPTTVSPDGTVRNPGLLQDHNGTGTCAGRNPCPASEVSVFPSNLLHLPLDISTANRRLSIRSPR